MMYPYITLADETEITHSHIMDSDGVQIVEVHFERPVEKGSAPHGAAFLPTSGSSTRGFPQRKLTFSMSSFVTTPICSTAMRRREGFTVPSLFRVVDIWYFSGQMRTGNRSMSISPKENHHLAPLKYG